MASSEEEIDFWCDYLLLKPEEASFLDLFRLLYFSGERLRDRKFIEWPRTKPKTRDLEKHRWIIFISLLAQVVFLLCKKPMARIGSFIEFSLNLLSGNGGLGKLLLNLLKGEVVKPDKSSAIFTSLIGNLDDRVELDPKTKARDRRRYGAALAMMAAKLSYENEAFIRTVVTDRWQMKLIDSYDFWNDYEEQSSTQAFMLSDKRVDPELIVIAFRGTSPFDTDDWQVDADISWYELTGVGRIHGGFMKALGLQKAGGWPKEIPSCEKFAYYAIRQKLREIVENTATSSARFIVTGHSLGGALAILFAGVLAIHNEKEILRRIEGVYTFGQPRVGDMQFGGFMEETLRANRVKYSRYVYCNDIVPRLPYDDRALLFKHFGTCLFFDSFYKSKVLREEPNRNYFSIWWAIPKSVNAIWELLRSFILPYMEGPAYREGWFLRLFRVIGLALPGLSAHCPQDYVNSTRLGSPPPVQL